MVNGTSPSESGVGTSLSSASPSPRPGEDFSSARLLRHLQGRVQQLRAQNESLRKSSENESLNESHCSVMSTESVGEIFFGAGGGCPPEGVLLRSTCGYLIARGRPKKYLLLGLS